MEKAEGKAPEPGNAEAGLTHHVAQWRKSSSGECKMFQKKQGSHCLRGCLMSLNCRQPKIPGVIVKKVTMSQERKKLQSEKKESKKSIKQKAESLVAKG